MRRLAKDLILHEGSGKRASGAKAQAADYVAEKLGPHLANLMGTGGFRALLSRALVLATLEVSTLSAVRVNGDGFLDGLESLRSNSEPAEFLEARTVLLAQLLGLLEAFIGPGLTERVIGEIWPKFKSPVWGWAGEEDASEKAN
jgi:hypothetical protein